MKKRKRGEEMEKLVHALLILICMKFCIKNNCKSIFINAVILISLFYWVREIIVLYEQSRLI